MSRLLTPSWRPLRRCVIWYLASRKALKNERPTVNEWSSDSWGDGRDTTAVLGR